MSFERFKVYVVSLGGEYTLKGDVHVTLEAESLGKWGFKAKLEFMVEAEDLSKALAYILSSLESGKLILKYVEEREEGEKEV